MSIRSATPPGAVGPPAGAAADEIHLVGEVALGHDGVMDAIGGANGCRLRHHARMNPLFDPTPRAARDAEQLDRITQLVGIGDVERAYMADPPDMDGA